MLLFPIAAALALPGAGLAAWELGTAFLMLFASHRAVLVATGWRLAPDRRCRSAAAAMTLVVGVLTMLLVVDAVRRSPAHVGWSLFVPVPGAAAFVAILAQRAERTVTGELLAALVLSSCSIPVTAAAGGGPATALVLALVWIAGFAIVALAIRSVIERVRPARASRFRLVAVVMAGAGIATMAALAAAGKVSGLAPIAQLPLCGLACMLALRPCDPRRMKSVGWLLVTASVLTLGQLILVVR